MLVSIFLRILYTNSYWICHLTAKGEDETGLWICHSVLSQFLFLQAKFGSLSSLSNEKKEWRNNMFQLAQYEWEQIWSFSQQCYTHSKVTGAEGVWSRITIYRSPAGRTTFVIYVSQSTQSPVHHDAKRIRVVNIAQRRFHFFREVTYKLMKNNKYLFSPEAWSINNAKLVVYVAISREGIVVWAKWVLGEVCARVLFLTFHLRCSR
jgi:hypothetical protein